ncbi:hypothetical protein [Formosa sp. PL04]|uniref:hypothetical protein n=1 Tax=Formosa sp. PL04 TaxID=3081755 RepID=UPI0029812366|nr:hypothetical protein [Formosa sp. PL04]MDW5288491.1 hypothetical protein [Formosa sp. PL04]
MLQSNQVNTHMQFKVDENRRLFIKKDILEISQWTDDLEYKNTEINEFSVLNRQLVKSERIQSLIQDFRRRNTLAMGVLCRYDQSLRQELEFGKNEYDIQRAKLHEKKRVEYLTLIKEYRALKTDIYQHLTQFQRK